MELEENNAGFVTRDEFSTELRLFEKEIGEELEGANKRILRIESELRQLQIGLKSQKVEDLRNQRRTRERLNDMTSERISKRIETFPAYDRISLADQDLLSKAGVKGGNKTRRWRSKKTQRRFRRTRSKL